MIGTMTWVGKFDLPRSLNACCGDRRSVGRALADAKSVPAWEALLEWLRSLSGPVKAFYEAGPTGFGLCRALTKAGIDAPVIVLGKTPRVPSDRVKTDCRTPSSWHVSYWRVR